MARTDEQWADVEVAVSQQPGEPDKFRVMFERSRPVGKVRLATVHVEGGESPSVARFSRASGAEASELARADFERKAVAVVRNLAEALAWDRRAGCEKAEAG
jgi:hypothetical protein